MLRNGARFLGLAVVLVLLSGATAAEPMKPAVAKLVAEADRVWRLNEQGDNIEAGRQSLALVRAADALRVTGKLDLAREYYRRAGLVRPWDLDMKLQQAEVLQTLGEDAAARGIAEQVQAFAESDRQLETSRAVLGVAPSPELPVLASLVPVPGEVVVGLVAMKGTERWLLDQSGRRIAEQFGVRVGVAAEPLSLGSPNRTGRSQLADELRRSLPWMEKRMSLYVPGGKLVRPESLSDPVVLAVMERLLDREGTAEQKAAFRDRMVQADAFQQWDANLLLHELSERKPQPGQGRVVQLALLPVDLFSGTANFLFGIATPDGNYGVVSYHRFAADFTGEPPNRTRLAERTFKQVLSSLGFTLGVPRCADPRCARSYPRSLAEHDAKGSGLCAECRAGFVKALGHELPAGDF